VNSPSQRKVDVALASPLKTKLLAPMSHGVMEETLLTKGSRFCER